ncbi:hypothetical protein K3181_00110 [Qipengyuania sp. YG27]|uniref:DUF1937 family protein n=1 Tax=Qipengyuania mesophila TaxID=2867246 RepID=A0ABS7JQB7_9SPHN|nr:hypothetical protein [Qipengyuania mesophila]MBX7499841.1 hypothetical protein [Qipengyuania mesophila]
MYASWPCPQPDGSPGEEMVLGFDKARQKRLLIAAPLFDEANKFRHQAFEIMRRLDAKGIDSFLPDLPGCNESLAPHSDQSIARWRQAVAAAATHFRADRVLTIRSGAWLVPEGCTGWAYAPAKPTQVLRAMLRARSLAAREAGRRESADALLAEGREQGLELAGWSLGAELVCELDEGAFALPEGLTAIEQTEVGGKPLWLRAENDVDPAQADVLATIVAAGMADA